MERRFRVRLDELLTDAEVPPGLLRGALPRLETFLQPFVATLHAPEQRTNARHYVQGLLSDLKGKDVESIAYLHDRERQGLQKFIGQVPSGQSHFKVYRMNGLGQGANLGMAARWKDSRWPRRRATCWSSCRCCPIRGGLGRTSNTAWTRSS